MDGTSTARGQSGLDRLLFFLLLVVGLVFVAPHVLGFAGVDVRAPADDASGPEYSSDHDLHVLDVRGTDVDATRSSIGSVRVTVSPAAGREPVNLTEISAIWIGDGSYDLTAAAASGGAADGTFWISHPESGGSIRVLDQSTDRAVLVFDVGTDDVSSAGEFGKRLQAGESASLTLVTERGEMLTRTIRVPEALPASGAVAL